MRLIDKNEPKGWESWYAWYPVYCYRQGWAWLERVERRDCQDPLTAKWQYRLIGK